MSLAYIIAAAPFQSLTSTSYWLQGFCVDPEIGLQSDATHPAAAGEASSQHSSTYNRREWLHRTDESPISDHQRSQTSYDDGNCRLSSYSTTSGMPKSFLISANKYFRNDILFWAPMSKNCLSSWPSRYNWYKVWFTFSDFATNKHTFGSIKNS